MNRNIIENFSNEISLIVCIIALLIWSQIAFAGDNGLYISHSKDHANFKLSASDYTAPLCVSSQDYPGVIRVLRQLQTDIEKVTNAKPYISIDTIPELKEIVLVGTIGKSHLIDTLIKNNKLDVRKIAGKW